MIFLFILKFSNQNIVIFLLQPYMVIMKMWQYKNYL